MLTLVFLGLYGFGAYKLFQSTEGIEPPAGISADKLVGATLFGLSMFATLFLGTVLSVFTTLGAIRGSVVLSATANGIAVFMLFGAGLVAGLLGQIGEALDSHTLHTIARVTSWAIPFEALYQDALNRITLDTTGFTEWALQLGPFGGAELGGTWLPLWTVAYLAGVLGLAVWAFARRDL